MKKLQIRENVASMAFGHILEDHIKHRLASQLAGHLADTFFNELELKRNNGDGITAVEYSYNCILFEPREYNNVMHKLDNILQYVRVNMQNPILINALVDLKSKMMEETTVRTSS